MIEMELASYYGIICTKEIIPSVKLGIITLRFESNVSNFNMETMGFVHFKPDSSNV